MAHEVSASYFRSDHMSPSALALAFLLHALTALALWWMSMHRPELPSEEPIEVTIEQPKPELPKPTPQAAPQPTPSPAPAAAAPQPPSPPVRLGLPPPAPSSTEPPQQRPSPQESSTPESAKQVPPSPPSAPPTPPVEEVVPPPAPPPPPPSALDFPKPTITPVPRPPPKPPQPPQQAQTPPPQQQLRSSPLSNLPQNGSPSQSQAAAPSGLVNPNEAVAKARTIDAYLWQVARKVSQYRFYSRDPNEQGTVVVRIVIARDGRLVDVNVTRSSGVITLDKGVIEAIHAAAPYAPLPAEIAADQVPFLLPVTARYRP